jgi:hypothetical protein
MRELMSFMFWVAVVVVICATFAVMGCDDLPVPTDEIERTAAQVRQLEWQDQADRWVESQRK